MNSSTDARTWKLSTFPHTSKLQSIPLLIYAIRSIKDYEDVMEIFPFYYMIKLDVINGIGFWPSLVTNWLVAMRTI